MCAAGWSERSITPLERFLLFVSVLFAIALSCSLYSYRSQGNPYCTLRSGLYSENVSVQMCWFRSQLIESVPTSMLPKAFMFITCHSQCMLICVDSGTFVSTRGLEIPVGRNLTPRTTFPRKNKPRRERVLAAPPCKTFPNSRLMVGSVGRWMHSA